MSYINELSMKPKNRIYCPQCNRLKLQFESKAKAENFIRYNADEIQEENGYAPIRAYYCRCCCSWHVTSRPEHKSLHYKQVIDHALVRRSKHHLNGPGEPWTVAEPISPAVA